MLLAVDFDKKAWQEDTTAFPACRSELSILRLAVMDAYYLMELDREVRIGRWNQVHRPGAGTRQLAWRGSDSIRGLGRDDQDSAEQGVSLHQTVLRIPFLRRGTRAQRTGRDS